MADRKTRAVVADLSGGRNGVDSPTSPRFKETQCLDAVNVDWWQTDFAHKRYGSSTVGTTGMTMTGAISRLHRHVPGSDDTAAELWANDDAATVVINRLAGGTAWAAPTLKDSPTGNGWDVSYASLNGLLFIAYKSAQGRLHCWDASTVRRAGFATPAAPTVANTAGGGTYPAVKAYWRVRWITEASGATTRRSEAGPSIAFTPDGAHDGVVITQPTPANEGETHWEIELSTDNVTFYVVAAGPPLTGGEGAAPAIGTTTFTVQVAVQGIQSLNPASPTTGTYTAQKSYRFIAADQGRLLGFGSWTSTDKQNDVEVSGVIGSLNIGDAERVDTTSTYRYTLDENDSGQPTGLRGPVFGNFYAFKSRKAYELAPTGSPSNPYTKRVISSVFGSVQGSANCVGEDGQGNPCLYTMTHKGVYRYGLMGWEYIGHGIEDYVIGPTAMINLGATHVVCHMTYHTDKRQLWVFWATGSSNDPNQGAMLAVDKGGWSRIPTSDVPANTRCSALFSNTLGASMSRDLKPYLGSATASITLYKADDTTKTDDAGTTFQAYVDTKDEEPGGPGFYGEVADAEIFGRVSSGVTITATATPDFDSTLAVSGTAVLTAAGSETRRTVRCQGSAVNGAGFVRYRVGDATAVSNNWTVDRLLVPHEKHEARTA